MSRCVPDSDELHDPPPMYQEEELFAYADNNLPCWSDCGMWDVDLKWVDSRPGLVSVGSWKDDTPHSIVDQATGDTILDHTAPSFDASSSDSKNLISWFDSHDHTCNTSSTVWPVIMDDHTCNTSSTVWPVIMDTVGVVAAGTQEDALVPAYQNVDKPTSVHGRRVADKRPAEGNAPACRNDGRSRSVAPKDRQGRVPPGIPDEVTRRVERPDKKPRKAVDQIVDKAPSSVSTKRSRAAADHHNLSERRRRNKFNEKLRTLQKLIPHAASKGDKVSVLDEVISYTKRLQSQADMMTATYSPVMMMANVMNNPMVAAAAATMARQFQLASAAQMAQLASMPMSGFSCLPNARSVPGGNPFAAVLPSQAHH